MSFNTVWVDTVLVTPVGQVLLYLRTLTYDQPAKFRHIAVSPLVGY